LTGALLPLLHVCDSAFPIGAFAYSDGLEWATATGAIADAAGLRAWLAVCLDEGIGRTDGPAVWQAWRAVCEEKWHALEDLDADIVALRPSASARRSSRAMGARLLTMWRGLHPAPRLDHLAGLVRDGRLGPTLPVAFAAACACAGIERHAAVEAFAYARLSSTISAAMRLMPIGQVSAHTLLADALARVPSVVLDLGERGAPVESFTPLMDIAQMNQQYLHSRLFRS
jgi:urease accessory protein